MIELLASLILWTGIDKEAKLEVSCDQVTLDIGIEAKATDEPVSFWVKDPKYGHTWRYTIPMNILPNGKIELEPTEYWIEEIRQQHELVVRVRNTYYNFDLTGTKKQIRGCGEIGKHNGLKIRRSKGLEGSIPSFPTKHRASSIIG